MSSIAERSIAVVGAGPRGTSFLERLLAHLEQTAPRRRPRLRITVFDPSPHGPGKVWNPAQSPLYLMNTPASYPTAAPTGETQNALPASSCSMGFLEYATLSGLDYDDGDFPARADYGQYLAWLSREVSARLRGCGAAVEHLSAEVTALEQDRSGCRLKAESTWYRADAVVLSLGHLPAEPSGPSAQLARTAAEAGLHYQGPAIPTDVDYADFPPGENVLVRGMGLNFFDFLIQVTAGRGGQFHEHPDAAPGRRYQYLPSGREPMIIAGSRRGTPYRAKTTAKGFVPAAVELRHFTEASICELLEESSQLDFAKDLWPLIQADAAEACRRAGGTADQFDIETFAHPFARRTFRSHTEYQQHLVDWLTEDAAGAEAAERSPQKMAVNAVHAARLRMKPLLAQNRITPASRLRDVEGWFEPLIEGLASGPPVQRTEELAALVRAGVVEFLGPSPVYGVDRQAGRFIADSAAVAGARCSAEHMIEAMMPPNRITQAASPLVRDLLASGRAQPASFRVGGDTHRHKGFEVSSKPHRLLRDRSQSAGGIYVLGLQLSSVQWGTAIAAEAGGDPQLTAHTLADADAAAREVLEQLG